MTTIDKRQYERVVPVSETAVQIDKTSVRIQDISSGGLSLKFFDASPPLKEKDCIDLSLGNLSLPDIPVEVAWHRKTSDSEKKSILHSVLGLKFGDLTMQQRAMIDFFIYQNTAGNA